MSNCKITAMCNQKGGVTKTTTTANLGVGLAMQGKKVLLLDIDPQADLTTALGWPNQDALPMTLSDIMDKSMREVEFEHYGAILRHGEGVDLIPSSLELSGIEMSLVTAMSREFTLKSYLDCIKHEYDHIIIDCPPSLSMLTINALAAADSVIVPVQAQYLPAKGMTQLMKTIGRVRKQINPALKVDGVLLTLADMRTNLARLTADTLRQQYGSMLKIYKTHIPIAVKAAEISATGQSIFAYDKGGKVAQAYADFTKEVMADVERTKAKSTPCR
ncbi:MAG: AAA family ATPase [Oscillospiraceae bacterium]|nr:AAA family ATPase [Oscillospiraceae bacterium]